MIQCPISEIKSGTKVDYSSFKNITFIEADDIHVTLEDKSGNQKKIYISLFKKYGSIIS